MAHASHISAELIHPSMDKHWVQPPRWHVPDPGRGRVISS